MSNIVYEVPKITLKHLPVTLLYITKSKYDRDWHSTHHTHPFTEVMYITKGKGTFVFANESIPVQENDVIIINPHVEHTEKSDSESPLQYIVLGVQGLAFSSNAEKEPVIFYNYQQEKNSYQFYLEQLLEEVEYRRDGYEMILQNILEILLLKTMRKRTFNLEKAPPEKMSKDIALIKNYINEHFRENISLDLLSQLSHMNKYYLSHSFKKLVGISPIEYLIQTRIRESKILLETTDYPISDISTITGFSSQSFFSQSFKRETQLSPSQYRNRQTKAKAKLKTTRKKK